jgi:uncharacterized protein
MSPLAQRRKECQMDNVVTWFEIPVADMDRAIRFYATVLGVAMQRMDGETTSTAFFPNDGGVGGSLNLMPGRLPSEQGTLVYLNAGADLGPLLARVEEAGGAIVMPETSIGEHGAIAVIRDSEGNRIGLHAQG